MNERVNIICLYWVGDFRGRDFTTEDVARLRASVDKHIDRPYDFYCLTNDMTADVPAIKIELQYAWPGWWSKMELHRPDLPPGRTLYMDLDSHVVNNLAPILDYPGDLVMFNTRVNKWRRRAPGVRDVFRYQAATMLFTPGGMAEIFYRFCEDPEHWMKRFRSDQDLMGLWIPNQPTFPDVWMVKLNTLRTLCKLPEDVIIVTGQPKDVSFRRPSFALWLEQVARGKEELCT